MSVLLDSFKFVGQCLLYSFRFVGQFHICWTVFVVVQQIWLYFVGQFLLDSFVVQWDFCCTTDSGVRLLYNSFRCSTYLLDSSAHVALEY